MKQTLCDRCRKVIPLNAIATEVLSGEYPDQDICPNCDIEIKMAGIVAAKSTLNREKPEAYLRRWAALYGMKAE